jgi:hypothetical protein
MCPKAKLLGRPRGSLGKSKLDGKETEIKEGIPGPRRQQYKHRPHLPRRLDDPGQFYQDQGTAMKRPAGRCQMPCVRT